MCLDLGCGAGNARNALENLGYEYIGIDRFKNTDTDIITDASKLPVNSNVFELVVASSSFEHFEDPWLAAKEVFRVLSPGGYAVISLSFLEPYHARSHYHMSHLGAKKLFHDAGFQIVSIEPFEWNGPEVIAQTLFQLKIMKWMVFAIVRPTLWIRRIITLLSIRLFSDIGKKKRAREFLEEEEFRFAAGIKLKLLKPEK